MKKRKKLNAFLAAFLAAVLALSPVVSTVASYAEELASQGPCTRIIVGTDNEALFEGNDALVSSYDGLYYLEYGTQKEADAAYSYYEEIADFVSYDVDAVKIADEEEESREESAEGQSESQETETSQADSTETSEVPAEESSEPSESSEQAESSEAAATEGNSSEESAKSEEASSEEASSEEGSSKEVTSEEGSSEEVSEETTTTGTEASSEEASEETSEEVSEETSEEASEEQSEEASESEAEETEPAEEVAENPVTRLEQALANINFTVDDKKPLIVMIDTGASVGGNVIGAVSMIGDSTEDDNGHGTQMVDYILSENPEAQIVSVKAMAQNGKATVASVIAAIAYAEGIGADYINFSAYAVKSEQNAAVSGKIAEAIASGITFVGAAGNEGKKVQYYIPGFMEEAMIVGAVDENGLRIRKSNYGNTVDWYVIASSTSEAAAKMTGILSAGKDPASLDSVFDNCNGEDKDYPSPDFKADVTFGYQTYKAYAEAMTGQKLDRTGQEIAFYNTFVDQAQTPENATIASLFGSDQEGYSAEMLLGLGALQQISMSPIYKGADGFYYAVNALYGMGGYEPIDSQAATQNYNYLTDSFEDIKYLGRGVYQIPADKYDTCYNGKVYTDENMNLIELVFKIRIQGLYRYDPASVPETRTINAYVTYPDGRTAVLPAVIEMASGYTSVRMYKENSDMELSASDSYSVVINNGETAPKNIMFSDDMKTFAVSLGESKSVGSLEIVIDHNEARSSYQMGSEMPDPRPAYQKHAFTVASDVETMGDGVKYLTLGEGKVPSNLAVGDKFIYKSKNVYKAAVDTVNPPSGPEGAKAVFSGGTSGSITFTAGSSWSNTAAGLSCTYALNTANNSFTIGGNTFWKIIDTTMNQNVVSVMYPGRTYVWYGPTSSWIVRLSQAQYDRIKNGQSGTAYSIINGTESSTYVYRHTGAIDIPTHNAERFGHHWGNQALSNAMLAWWQDGSLNDANDPDMESAASGIMAEMDEAHMRARASTNSPSVDLSNQPIFGYASEPLYKNESGSKTIDLDGAQLIFACMHAWAYVSTTTPANIQAQIAAFTGTSTVARNVAYGNMYPDVALMCTSVTSTPDANGYKYATFKCCTQTLEVGNATNHFNYQCGFCTLRIAFKAAEENGYLRVHKTIDQSCSWASGNKNYSVEGIQFKVYTNSNCTTEAKDADGKSILLTVGSNGYTGTAKMKKGTYYVREYDSNNDGVVGTNIVYSGQVYTAAVTTAHTTSKPFTVEAKNKVELDPRLIVVYKIDANGSATNTPIQGAVFTIKAYDSSSDTSANATWTATTNSNGYADLVQNSPYSTTDDFGTVTRGFAYGYYTVQETTAPTGYIADTTLYHFTVDSTGVHGLQSGLGNNAALGILVKEVKKVDSTVQKAWSGTFPAQSAKDKVSLKVSLLQDGKAYSAYQNVTLEKRNNWTYTTSKDLPEGHFNSSGQFVAYTYTWKLISETFNGIEWPWDASNSSKNPYNPTISSSNRITTITNHYDASGKITISGKKELKDGDLSTDHFTMELYQSDGNGAKGRLLKTTKTNDNGEYEFSFDLGLSNVSAEPVRLLLCEKDEGKAGITYDHSEYLISYKVTDIGDGKLRTSTDVWRLKDKNGRVVSDTVYRSTNQYEENVAVKYNNSASFINIIPQGGVQLTKFDIQAKSTLPQGDASFENIEFTITNKTKIYKNGTWYEAGKFTKKIYTNSAAHAETALNDLPYGKYELKETATNGSYLLTDGTARPFTVDVDGVLVAVDDNGNSLTQIVPTSGNGKGSFGNNVVRGGVEIQKLDKGTLLPSPQGDADLSGIQFTIVNRSANRILVYYAEDGKTASSERVVEKGGTVYVITTDANGKASTKADALPYGTYSIRETKTNGSYLLTDTTARDFEIRQNNVVVKKDKSGKDLVYNVSTAANGSAFKNEVIRGGVRVQKIDDETLLTTPQGDADLAGIEFSITNKSKHPVLVNGTVYEPGKVVAKIVTNSDGIAETAKDTLPYGTYEIRETASNGKYQLTDNAVRTFLIRENGVIVTTDKGGKDLVYRAATAKTSSVFKDVVVRGGVTVQKIDDELDSKTPQGDADFKDIEFSIRNVSAKAVVVNGTSYEPGKIVAKIKTNADGIAKTAADLLPYGTYEIFESATNSSYLLTDQTVRTCRIRENGVIVSKDVNGKDLLYKEATVAESSVFQDKVVRGGVRIQKIDEETLLNTPQGDADFSGIEFSIRNASPNAVLVNGVVYKKGEVVAKIVTNRDGVAETAADTLPYGTYEIFESDTNASYLLTDNAVRTVEIRKNGIIVEKDADGKDLLYKEATAAESSVFKDMVVRGGVKVLKVNDELDSKGEKDPSQSLKDAKILVINASAREVFMRQADGVSGEGLYGFIEDRGTEGAEIEMGGGYTRDELIAAIKANPSAIVMELSTDEEGYVETAKDALPYGTYYLIESVPSEGFVLNEDWVVRVEIRTNEKVEDLTADYRLKEQPIRGDIRFMKTNENGKGKSYIPFLLCAVDEEGRILEAHVIVTNKIGVYDSARNAAHSENTNKMDSYVSFDEATGEYRISEEGEALLPEAWKYGTWFGKVAPMDDRGALYYGDFKLIEIKCNDNEALEEDLLTSSVFSIGKADEDAAYKGYTYKDEQIGDITIVLEDDVDETYILPWTLVNLHVDLESVANDTITDTHITFAGRTNTLSDRISYTHLKTTSRYKFIVIWRDLETGEELARTTSQDFSPVNTADPSDPTASGEITVEQKIDVANRDGHRVTAEVRLYQYGTGYDFDASEELNTLNLIATHNTEHDEKSEYVYIPKMETEAMDSLTRTRVGAKNKKDLIVDTVTLYNIEPNRAYVLIETLKDDEGNVYGENKTVVKPFSTENGEDVILKKTIEMPAFELDSSEFGAKTYIVQERLYRAVIDGSNYELADGEDMPVVVHESLVDENQTIRYISTESEARDNKTEDHVGACDANDLIIDKVTIHNTVKGVTYDVSGRLLIAEDFTADDGTVYKKGQELAVSTGKIIGIENGGDADTELRYTLDASNLGGAKAVVMNVITVNGEEVDRHEDYDDENQKIYWPLVHTTEVDSKTFDHVGTSEDSMTLKDTVECINLIPGMTYVITGKLMIEETGEEVEGYSFESVRFTAEEANESHVMTFTGINSKSLEGKSLVAYEYLSHYKQNDTEKELVEVAKHEDLSDEGQTVHIPHVRTTAIDENTGSHAGSIFGGLINAIRRLVGDKDADGNGIEDSVQQNVIDTVELTNLVPGCTYTVNGVLMDQATGEPVVIDGANIRKTATIKVAEDGSKLSLISGEAEDLKITAYDAELGRVDATICLRFVYDSSKLISYGTDEESAHTVVVFEDLVHNEVTVAVHNELSDVQQMVSNASIHTTAIDKATGDHVGDTPRKDATHATVEDKEESVIVDRINLGGIVEGEQYKVIGTLVVKGGEGEKAMYLKADGTLTENKEEAISAFLEFTTEDMKDYAASGDGISGNGYVELELTVPCEEVAGKTVVVFEDLYVKHPEGHYVMVTTHSDVNDEQQSVYYPDIHTNATDDITTDDVGVVGTTTITDIVTYTNLLPDEEYVIKGKLVYQTDCVDVEGRSHTAGEVLTRADGSEVTAEVVLKAGEHGADGSAELHFEVESEKLQGLTTVAFEELHHDNIKVDAHADITDKPQTVHFPKVRTRAVDSETGDHVGSIRGGLINGAYGLITDEDADGNGIADDVQQNIIDTVSLTNLVPGRVYTVSGILMDKATGEALEIDGEQITQTVTFKVEEDGSALTITEGNGVNPTILKYDEELNQVDASIDMVYAFDSSKLQNDGRTLVVFEDLLHNDVAVAVHHNLEDTDQSVNDVEVHTVLLDDTTKDHVGTTPSTIWPSTLTDTVALAKLVSGEEYTVTGVLIDTEKTTKDEVVYILDEEGNKVTAQLKFRAGADDENFMIEDTDGFSVKGSVLIHFNAGMFVEGKSVTAVESLYHNDVLIAEHGLIFDEEGKLIIDGDQSVYYPTGKTNATDNATGTHTEEAEADRVITDSVYFQTLQEGCEYKISGELVYKEDFTDAEGVEHKAGDKVEGAVKSVTFIAGEDKAIDSDGNEVEITNLESKTVMDGTTLYSGYVALTFTVDAKQLAGATIVAFERFYHNNAIVFVHADLEDAPETIRIPKIGTQANVLDLDEGSVRHYDAEKQEYIWNTIEIIDTVAFENLWTEEDLRAMHEAGLKIKNGAVEDDRDGKVYEINESGTYILAGILIDKATGEPIKDNDGKVVTGVAKFTPDKRDGKTEVKFEIDLNKFLTDEGECRLESATLVAYEELFAVPYGVDEEGFTPEYKDDSSYYEDRVAKHEDLEDTEQDIRFPKGRTHANDLINKDGEAEDAVPDVDEGVERTIMLASENMTILDKVSYENLHGGTEYTVTGNLMVVTERNEDGTVKAYEAAKDDEGKPITATKTFVTPGEYEDSVSGFVIVKFEFSGLNLAGHDVVAFEECRREGQLVFVHADINDERQTIDIPKIGTTAVDTATEDKDVHYDEKVVIEDTVKYENLIPGQEYVMTGTLVDKETGEEIKNADGEVCRSSEPFTPKKADGEIVISFEIDSTVLTGKTIVAFEDLTIGKKTIAIHHDIEDKEQTVYVPEIRTTAVAKDSNDHTLTVDTMKKLVIVDTVSYKNLTPGKEYILKGVLMDKENKAQFKEYAKERKFTPETSEGTVTLEFEISWQDTRDNMDVVVFEKVFDEKDNLIAIHEDLEDKDQTVHIVEPKGRIDLDKPDYPTPEIKVPYGIGDIAPWKPIAISGAGLMLILALVLIARRKKEEQG